MISNVGGSAGCSSTAMSQRADKMFAKLDANGDGSIDKQEMATAFGSVSDKLFSKFDTNGDGSISKDESAAGLQSLHDELASHHMKMHKHHHGGGGNAAELFKSTDANGDGAIDQNEFTKLLNKQTPQASSDSSTTGTSNDNSLNSAYIAFAMQQYQFAQALPTAS